MNESDEVGLDVIWDQLYEYKSKTYNDDSCQNQNECCLSQENIVDTHEGFVCCVCGVVSKVCLFQEGGFSDQSSLFITGTSTEISTRFCNSAFSSSLKRTNYKLNNDKNFIKQKTYWVLKNFIKNKIEKSFCGIPESVVEECVSLFRMFEEKPTENNSKTIVRRNVRQGVISACLYLSCKKSGLFRSPLEISNIMDVEKSLVIKGCKILRDKLLMKNETSPHISHFLPRICSELKLPFSFEKDTIELFNKIKDNENVKKFEPKILTGTLLYIIGLKSGIDLKKNINSCLNISEASINKIYNDIKILM
jgi:transcription initiation factor TFIIIB Brf1 subunit/transcription initiation factor TFIIB